MKKYDGEMVRTKKEKFTAIIELLNAQENVDTELVEMCTNEIAMIDKKANASKEAKAKKQNDTYKDALAQIMELFQTKPVLFNDDVDFLDNTSKKTKAFTILMEQGKVEKCPKKRAKDKVSYRLVGSNATPSETEEVATEEPQA